MTSDKIRGLEKSLYVAVGAQVNLTSNIWQGVGLTNGCRGAVRDIVYENGQAITDMPNFIVVEFYNYIGPPFFVDSDRQRKWIPISSVYHYPRRFQTKLDAIPAPIVICIDHT